MGVFILVFVQCLYIILDYIIFRSQHVQYRGILDYLLSKLGQRQRQHSHRQLQTRSTQTIQDEPETSTSKETIHSTPHTNAVLAKDSHSMCETN